VNPAAKSKLATVFNQDSSDEEEEIPEEARYFISSQINTAALRHSHAASCNNKTFMSISSGTIYLPQLFVKSHSDCCAILLENTFSKCYNCYNSKKLLYYKLLILQNCDSYL